MKSIEEINEHKLFETLEFIYSRLHFIHERIYSES